MTDRGHFDTCMKTQVMRYLDKVWQLKIVAYDNYASHDIILSKLVQKQDYKTVTLARLEFLSYLQ